MRLLSAHDSLKETNFSMPTTHQQKTSDQMSFNWGENLQLFSI